MKTLVLTIILSLMLYSPFYGQCSDKLVESAISQSGADAMFIREFKVKLQKGSVRNPVPVAKFNVFMKEDNNYRFCIVTDNNPEDAILQLFDNGKCIAGTFDDNKRENIKKFDFKATRTGNYQVIISFIEGKPGCAAGVMSLIDAETVRAELSEEKKNSEPEIVYLNVKNPLLIETDKEPADSLILLTDNGTVAEKDGNHYILPEKEGFVTLKVIIKNKDGKVKEEAASEFVVQRLPAINATLNGINGGIISRSLAQIAEGIEINHPIEFEKFGFEVLDFIVKIDAKGGRKLLNPGKYFSAATKNAIAEIPENTRLVFESIHVRTPEGKTITLEPLGFIIR